MNRYAEPPPPEAVPLPRARYLTSCLAGTLREVPALLRPTRRTPDASRGEYERRWAWQDAEARWRGAGTLADAVASSSYGDRRLHALIESAPYDVPAPAFFRWRARKLARVLAAHHPVDTPVTEVGCGVGKNLQALALAGYRELAGFDVTESAVAGVRDWSAQFGIPVETGRLDLLDPSPEVLRRLAGRVVLTNHVLEQLPRHLPVAVHTLLHAAPREVVHLEPCAEPLRPGRSLFDLASDVHLRACDYQRSLLTVLREQERQGRLRLVEIEPMGYAPRLRNAPTLIRWCPR